MCLHVLVYATCDGGLCVRAYACLHVLVACAYVSVRVFCIAGLRICEWPRVSSVTYDGCLCTCVCPHVLAVCACVYTSVVMSIGATIPSESPLVVIKVGTSTLMKVCTETGEQRVNLPNLGALVDTVTTLYREGYGVIIVTSAAVGFGCLKLKLTTRPTTLALKQAVAAAGQSSLIRMYEDLFAVYGVPVAQILLSRFDFSAKDRYANVHNALKELLHLRVIPIINENDTVSTDELRFGNNDTLSALVAVGVSAQKLFILTDVDCLYTGNPRTNPQAVPILDMSASELGAMGVSSEAEEGGEWGTGGMATKLIAARTAVCAGIQTVLLHGAFPDRVCEYLRDDKFERPLCTVFHLPSDDAAYSCIVPCGSSNSISTMTPLRRWLLALPVKGTLWLNEGAVGAVFSKNSLFAVGILEVHGKFKKDECVALVDRISGTEFARALMNLNHEETNKIKGLHSNQYENALGYPAEPELAHRRNIIITAALDHVDSNNA